MKSSTFFSALTIAAAAAVTLSLPATASADPIRHEGGRGVVRGEQPRDNHMRPVHDSRPRYVEARDHRHDGWREARRHQHDHGHHYGHRERRDYRHDYRPVVRQDYVREVYRPVVRVLPPAPVDDLRIRISYDINL